MNIKKYLLLYCLLTPIFVYTAPKSEYVGFWDQYDNDNTTTIAHSDFNTFLDKYVSVNNGINTVDYQNVSPADKKLLDNYIEKLASLPILSFSQPTQQAYWINLYNALTIRVILDNYPMKSIREAHSIFKSGPWDKELLTIEGKNISLNDIEHRILRPIWKDA